MSSKKHRKRLKRIHIKNNKPLGFVEFVESNFDDIFSCFGIPKHMMFKTQVTGVKMKQNNIDQLFVLNNPL